MSNYFNFYKKNRKLDQSDNKDIQYDCMHVFTSCIHTWNY